MTGQYKTAYNALRDVVVINKDKKGFWSIFRFVYNQCQKPDQKYLIRLLNLYPLKYYLFYFKSNDNYINW